MSDSQDALTELNSMWNAWGIDEGLIYAILTQRFQLASGIAIYTIGPGGGFSTARPPARIYRASVSAVTGGAIASENIANGGTGYAVSDTGVVLNGQGNVATYSVTSVDADGSITAGTITAAGTGYLAGYGYATAPAGGQPGTGSGFFINVLTVTAGGQNRNELAIIEAGQYYAHNDLAASAAVPDELYPDYAPDPAGVTRLYFWPVPNVATLALELENSVAFSDWALSDNYVVPPGFQDALQWALAFRLIPRYGAAVAQQIVEVVTSMAPKAEMRIREMNAKNRRLPPGVQAAPGTPEPAAARA